MHRTKFYDQIHLGSVFRVKCNIVFCMLLVADSLLSMNTRSRYLESAFDVLVQLATPRIYILPEPRNSGLSDGMGPTLVRQILVELEQKVSPGLPYTIG